MVSLHFFFSPIQFAIAAEDLGITRIAGLSWEQWNARLVLPLVTELQEGSQPLVFPSNEPSSPPESNDANDTNDTNDNNDNNDDSLDQLNKPLQSSQNKEFNDGKLSDGETKNSNGYSCSECGRFYKLKSSLRNHQKWECGKEPQFSCPFCVYKAKQKMHINRHLERMHKEKLRLEISNGIQVYKIKDEHQNLNSTA